MPALCDMSVITIKLEYKWTFRASFNVLLLIPKELGEILHFDFFWKTKEYHRDHSGQNIMPLDVKRMEHTTVKIYSIGKIRLFILWNPSLH